MVSDAGSYAPVPVDLIRRAPKVLLHDHLDVLPRGKGFGNGRAVRNLFEATLATHAQRVVRSVDPSDADLTDLTADDLRAAIAGAG